jgi:dTDP-4-dehydrorhamnose reductase
MRIPPSILITGASGQLGMELQAIAEEYPRYRFIPKKRGELPIDNPVELEKVFEEVSPAYCINAAAYTAVDKAEELAEREKVFGVNAAAVHSLASCCDRFGTKLIHISTDYVFDGSGNEPYKEDDDTAPLNIYGRSKREGEELALSFGNAVILRTSWVYSSFGKNFLKTMIRLMSERKEISVVNDQFGTPTYARDIAHAVMKITVHKEWIPGIYHFTNHGVTTWFEFAGFIRELINSDCIIHPISTAQYPTPAKRPAWSVLDTTRITETFGIVPRDWQEGVRECVERMGTEL